MTEPFLISLLEAIGFGSVAVLAFREAAHLLSGWKVRRRLHQLCDHRRAATGEPVMEMPSAVFVSEVRRRISPHLSPKEFVATLEEASLLCEAMGQEFRFRFPAEFRVWAQTQTAFIVPARQKES